MSTYTIKKILVPVDLSESSLNALNTAAVIAKENGAQLHILYVEEPDYTFKEDKFPVLHNISNPSDVLYALGGAISQTHEVEPVFHEEEGDVTEMILKMATFQKFDLVIMGKHGASGYRDCFAGSNTYKVIKHATCPVLSVPSRKKITSFGKILFPVRPVSRSLTGYEIVSHFIKPGATLNVLGLAYRQTELGTGVLNAIVDEIRDQLKQDHISPFVSWGSGIAIAEDVINYAINHHPELIVITNALDVTSKPNYIGPHTQKIISTVKVPVLSLKNVNVPAFA
ncbi:MAG: universal stress protein [Flavisolibacter sp.]